MNIRKHHSISLAGLALLVGVAAYGLFSTNAPAFSEYEAGPERKQAFFEFFLPVIEQKNQQVLQTRAQVESWYEQRDDLSWVDKYQVESLAEQYDLAEFDVTSEPDWQELLERVDVVPPSLALAQAAKESGWGTSRFANEGNNFFGQWCFQEGCGLVPNNRAANKSHEVAKFDSPAESVEKYIHNLNTHRAYDELRDLRAEARKEGQRVSGQLLATGLDSYSERGEKYVAEIRGMIRHNELAEFD